METISEPWQLEDAWKLQYERLAKKFASLLSAKRGPLVEIGCGRGQLTVPLARLVPNQRITVVDRFAGPYRDDYGLLKSAMSQERSKRRISVVVADYVKWLSSQRNQGHNAMISSEFLSEIDSDEMRKLFSDCYRILEPGGLTVHSFLSPVAKNPSQRLVIEADSNPKWTKYPPKEWFSPRPELVVNQIKLAGFRRVRVASLKSGLTIKAKAAQSLLENWGVKEAFWKSYQSRLVSKGLEIPDWVIVTGAKLR